MRLSAHETDRDSRQITQFLAGNEIMFTEKHLESHPVAFLQAFLLAAQLRGFGGLVAGLSFSGLFGQPFHQAWLPRDARTCL